MTGKITRWVRSISCPEGMTPLPGKVISLLFFITLINGMTSTMCFSYLPKMIKSFGISEVETGHYAGLIATSVYFGYILFGLLWGYLGDIKGNKLAIMLSVSGLSLSTLAFGYSTSFYWALISRLLQGCFMGFVVTCKSVLADILDETNISLGFSIFYTCWTFAFIIGPSTAGFLAFPAEQYPNTFSKDAIFGKFGVLLPNLLIVICNVFILVATIIVLPEDKRSRKQEVVKGNSSIQNSTEDLIVENNFKDVYPVEDGKQNVKKTIQGKIGVLPDSVLICSPNVIRKVIQMFKSRDFALAVLANGILGFCIVGVEDMFPLFAATSREYYGLNYDTSQIGTILMISSAFLLVIQILITSRVSRRYGERKAFIGIAMLPVFAVPMIPVLSCITDSGLQRVCLIVVMLVNQTSINGGLVTLSILLNSLVSPDLYGSANGIAFTMSSLGRIIAPSLLGSLYSWSLKNVVGVAGNTHPLGFPFNQFFIFYIVALSFFVCALIVSTIRPKLDRK